MADGASRAQLKEVGLERLDDGNCLVRVEMVHKLSAALHQKYIGKAKGEFSPASVMRCAAEATLQALERAFHTKEGDLTFVDIKDVESFDKPAVIVAVNARHEGKTWRLVGFCEVVKDVKTTAAMAVCNALNRFLTMTLKG